VTQPRSFSRVLQFFVISIGLTLAACRARPALTAQEERGKRVYDVGCAHCHEENDLRLKKVPPDLHGLFNREKLPDGEPATDAEVEQVLMKGRGMMPSFAYQMSREQMEAVIAYLHAGIRKE
jgi:mono/diheme cytochrome c family protein